MARKRRNVPPPRRQRLIAEVERSRKIYLQGMIEELCNAANKYLDESTRDDSGRYGRLVRRFDRLATAVDRCHEALHPDPITTADIERAKRQLAWEHERARSAQQLEKDGQTGRQRPMKAPTPSNVVRFHRRISRST